MTPRFTRRSLFLSGLTAAALSIVEPLALPAHAALESPFDGPINIDGHFLASINAPGCELKRLTGCRVRMRYVPGAPLVAEFEEIAEKGDVPVVVNVPLPFDAFRSMFDAFMVDRLGADYERDTEKRVTT